jgi:hypothetical protein
MVDAAELVCRNSLGEPAEDAEDIWWIEEDKGYPRLWWELEEGEGEGAAEN